MVGCALWLRSLATALNCLLDPYRRIIGKDLQKEMVEKNRLYTVIGLKGSGQTIKM